MVSLLVLQPSASYPILPIVTLLLDSSPIRRATLDQSFAQYKTIIILHAANNSEVQKLRSSPNIRILDVPRGSKLPNHNASSCTNIIGVQWTSTQC